MLRAAEELLVLVLSDPTGALDPIPDVALDCALAGAVLMDLALADRIDTDLEGLTLLDSTPLGDDVLDPHLAEVARDTESRTTDHWVARIAESAGDIRAVALRNLVDRGIVDHDEGGLFSLSRLVSRSRRYPSVEGEAGREVTLRVMGVLFSDDIPSPQDVVIINLAHSCGMFERLLSSSEYQQVAERIELVAGMDLIGRAVTRTIQEAVESETGPDGVREGGWPRTSGLPIAGYYFGLSGDVSVWLAKQYVRHGPVFEIHAFGLNYIVLAGPEANQLAHRHGSHYFRTRDFYSGFLQELGAGKMLVTLDGHDHLRLRRVLRDSYSRGQIERNIPEGVAVLREEMATWPQQKPIRGFKAMQRLTAEFVGKVAADTSPRERMDDIVTYWGALVTTRLLGNRPALLMRSPHVRRARRGIEAHSATVMARHDPERRGDANPDVIDAIMELHRSDPQFMPETDMVASVMGPFVAGLDTVSGTAAFTLYALLAHPELLERAREEADEAFSNGGPSAMQLRRMETLHGVLMESMRRYPIATGVRRTVINSFDFAGYRIPAGSEVLIANTVTHHLPELFPDPRRFDIDRYKEPRREHTQPGAYTPFGVGPHTCLGSGFARSQIPLVMATLIHDYDIEMDPPGYELKISQVPSPKPNKRFKFRITPRSIAA